MHIKQISDYGTANPIVARLSLQTTDLLKFYNLSTKQQDDLFEAFFSNIQPKLMACCRIKEQLTKEIRKHQKAIDKKGLPTQPNGIYTLPYIFELEHNVETFLYNTKLVLRDLTEVFSILFGKDFKKEARYDKVLNWATDKFGKNDSFVIMLKQDQDQWIKRIIKMRNAVEHPGGYSGTLHIENFTASENENSISVTEPLWFLNDNDSSPIAHDLDVMISNLLTFCEETLILCLEKIKTSFPVVVEEIPEDKRDPACPKRYKITMKIELKPLKNDEDTLKKIDKDRV